MALILLGLTGAVACSSDATLENAPDTSQTDPDASQVLTDASETSLDTDIAPDAGMPPDANALHALPVVELPETVSAVGAPEGCDEHDMFEIQFALPASRFAVSAEDESIWTWGRDHYVDGYLRTGASWVLPPQSGPVAGTDQARVVGGLSEQLGPPRLFLLPDDEDGARRLFHRNDYLVKDGDALHEFYSTYFSAESAPEQRRGSWVMAVTPMERAILYETHSMDIWSCPLSCDQPASETNLDTDCPLVDNCDRLATLPEPENPRAVSTHLDGAGNLYWLGKQGVWRTALRGDGASELVLQTPVRSFTTNGEWIAWVELDGNAYLANRTESTRFRLATNLASPLYDEDSASSTVWTDAEVDVLKIEDDWIWWWDGVAMRGFDLTNRAILDTSWTTELPSRPLGFELGSCSSYTLFSDRILVRPLLEEPS